MKVLVCGDRNWSDMDKIETRLKRLPEGTTLIHGAARGADTLGGYVAERFCGFKVEAYPADWNKYHRAAGPIRNRQMLDQKPDLVIAFHSDLATSKGTKDCVMEARKRKIPVEVIE